ncbi:MAG: electron transport complex subunit RsxE, partial [Bacteroidales bacterium]|nr:electron transport complex subunit RsxE [Bacteroidales bacterium]
FTLGLTILGLIRELLGSGSIFGYKFIGDADGMLVFVLAPGAFIVLGYLIALVNRLKSK